ncbi:protein arginine kinase [Massiliimalia massiliensis]|uniref:protein arginine kinase n=1 Tax=Massiliimalia massiliensis TaxID=1852384 RepID=UPI000987A2D0|nr:protein arginine kinase [Massiliimalia massiliensis]
MSKWYELPAPHEDIVLSSRIRLARNLSDFPFESRMSDDQRRQLADKVKAALQDIPVGGTPLSFVEMESLDEIKRYAMVERHEVSREFVKNPKNRMLGLSADESVSIMVNEEDHLRIQVMANGLNLSSAFQLCNEIDDALDAKVDYAFDEKLGYLTTCPTNLGTGLRASVMVHLPALEKSGLMNQLTATINKLGLTIRGTYGEGSKVLGSIYQISNQITLGITEQDAIQNLESIVLQVIENEKHARESLLNDKHRLEDVVCRSLGALRYARLLSSKEFFEEVSNVRLGISLGVIHDVEIPRLNRLMALTGSASVCEREGKNLSPQDRDFVRAGIVRNYL